MLIFSQAIEGYRETERDRWNEHNTDVLRRIHEAAFAKGAQLLPRTHILDLAAAGYIRPHVDAVRVL